MKRITVFIITYNQEKEIKRALDSILCQKEWGLYKIIVSDDCSSDNTWKVLQDYKRRYPSIIEPHRNEHNLGIYANMTKLHSLLPVSDLYVALSGDDAFCDGFFKSTQEYIHNNNVDITQPIGIFGDYIAINTSGEQSLMKNDFVLKGYDPMGAYLRSMATCRGALFSLSVLSQFKPVETNKGLILAETLFDSQFFRFINKAYYNPIPGTIYYTGIGVSVTWGLGSVTSSYRTTDNIVMWQYLVDNGLISSQEDKCWANCRISYSRCLVRFSRKEYSSYCKNYLKGMKSYHINYKRFILQAAHLLYLGIKYARQKKS